MRKSSLWPNSVGMASVGRPPKRLLPLVLGALAVFTLASISLVASIWAGDLHPDSYSYGDSRSLPTEDRREYLSQGQVYLRNFIREQLLKFMAENGMPIDEEKLHDAVSMDVTRLYADPGSSLQTRIHVYADSRLDSYYGVGRFLPVEIEVDSSYHLQDNLKLKAKMEAPFNSVTVLNLGSEFLWENGVSSIRGDRLSTGSQVYDGFNLGLAFQMSNWRVKLDYDLTPDFVSFNHLNFSTNF